MNQGKNIFSDKSVLIFGAANGIGRAVAMEFARRGSSVAVADIDNESAAATAEAIQIDGGRAVALACDVTSDQSMRSAVEEAEATFGDIDIVVNNVGVIVSGNPEDIPLAEWQRVVNLNLFPAIRSNDIFLTKFLQRGSGHIVNTASFSGLYPYASNRIPYAASKAALIALSESLALYLEPKGIRISCFCPGPVMTNVMKGMKSWSENAVMSGPGSQYDLMTAEQAADKLAEGMAAGQIFIPTHPHVLDRMQDHAADPDGFVRRQIETIAKGELGLPKR
jgi:NAD(P)-dependent dehydrogenase (short-subunit alcohol dehydrogenase family)